MHEKLFTILICAGTVAAFSQHWPESQSRCATWGLSTLVDASWRYPESP
jgi:hypothetical protein